MRSVVMMFVLAPFLCINAAFASEAVAVTLPFAFVSHGETFPASRYDVNLSSDHQHLSITSREMPGKHLLFIVTKTDTTPSAPLLSILFDHTGSIHELRSIRLGSYATMVSRAHTNVSVNGQVSTRLGK